MDNPYREPTVSSSSPDQSHHPTPRLLLVGQILCAIGTAAVTSADRRVLVNQHMSELVAAIGVAPIFVFFFGGVILTIANLALWLRMDRSEKAIPNLLFSIGLLAAQFYAGLLLVS